MRTYPIKTPRLIQQVFPKWIWRRKDKENVMYLTFDDGPTPKITEWVLAQLSSYQAKATFFCIGKNMEAHPTLTKKILSEGHTLGNHTFAHENGWHTGTAAYLKSIDRTQQLIDGFSHDTNSENNTSYFRPPYGKIGPIQARKLRNHGYRIVMWDVLSGDFDIRRQKEHVWKNVKRNARRGSVVVFHDSMKAAKHVQHALPIVLEYFTEKGYRFEALPV